jgi:hypothetical protein
MGEQMDDSKPIAERKLIRMDTGGTVVVRIFAPRPEEDPPWQCPYTIEGLDTDVAWRALGEDSVQCLRLVFDAIRATLEETGLSFSDLDGSPGTGFYRYNYDPDTDAIIEHLAEAEAIRFGRYMDVTRRLFSGRKDDTDD